MKKKKKKEEFYFHNLYKCSELAEEAAGMLLSVFRTFEPGKLTENMERMHEIEHRADMKRHKLMKTASEAFITPIEREDLVALSDLIDDLTDAVEDILRQVAIGDINALRADMLPWAEILAQGIGLVKALMEEFSGFKHSKKIQKLVVEINDIEEKGDQLYMDSMKALYRETDVKTVVIWKDIYQCIENCMDTCEHVAETVQRVVMKNL